MEYRSGDAFAGSPDFTGETGKSGERLIANEINTASENEVYVDKDIMVLANPEIANLPVGSSLWWQPVAWPQRYRQQQVCCW